MPKPLTDLLDEAAVRELAGYFTWQRRYAQARQQGCADSDARDYADGRQSLPPLAT